MYRFKLVICFVLGYGTSLALSPPTSAPTTQLGGVPSMQEQIAELRTAGEPVEPVDLKAWPTLPDDRNAAKVVEALHHRLYQPGAPAWNQALKKRGISDYQLPLSNEDRDSIGQVVEASADVLQQLDLIRTMDGFDWGDAPPSPLATKHVGFPHDLHPTGPAHLLMLDGLLAIENGEMDRAWRNIETLRKFAEGMSFHPSGAGFSTWRHIHELAVRLAADASAARLDTPNASDRDLLVALTRYWFDEQPTRDSFIRELQRERVAIVDTEKHLRENALDPKQLGYSFMAGSLHGRRIGTSMWPAVVAFHTGIIDTLRDAEAISWASSTPALDEFYNSFFKRGFVPSHVVMQLGPWYAEMHSSVVELRAKQKLSATAIAIRLYRMDHAGEFPKNLDDLVPAYLPDVPTDPTLPKPAPLRYRAGESPMIWAAGHNRRDDDGRGPGPGVSIAERLADADKVVHLTPRR